MNMESAIILWLIIMFLTLIHEFGHFIMARICDEKVSYFAIGFGPALISVQDRKGTNWRINLIPLGGYVEMSDNGNETDTMLEMSPIKNILISLGGPLINILFFLIGGIFFYNLVGLNTIEYKHNNNIFYIPVYNISTPPKVHFCIKKDTNSHKDILYNIDHNSEFFQSIININQKKKNNIKNISISLNQSFKFCVFTIKNLTYRIIYTVTHWSEIKKLKSILMAYKQVKIMINKSNNQQEKFNNIFLWMLLFSLQLGLFNLLPIFGLDGFWILMSLIGMVFKPSLSFQRKFIIIINYGTYLLFMSMGFLLIKDIYSLILEFFFN